MVFSVLTETGVGGRIYLIDAAVFIGAFINGLNINLSGVCQTKGQLIAVDLQFHGVAHGSKFDNRDFRPGNHTHIQKMLPQSTFTAYCSDQGTFTYFQIFQSHLKHLHFEKKLSLTNNSYITLTKGRQDANHRQNKIIKED